MITVLHVIDTGGPGGAETVFLNLCSGLDRQRFRSVCVVSRPGWLVESLRARGVESLIVPSSGSFNLPYLRRIMQIARRERVDLIVGHLYGSAVYCSMAGALLRIPVVSVLHGHSDIAGPGRLGGLKNVLIRTGTSRLVFVSDRLKTALKTLLNVPERKCTVIPNGVDISRFRQHTTEQDLRTELGVLTGQILVGAVGNIRAPKSYDVFLRAARLLKDQSPLYRFVIVGEGSGKLYDEMLSLRGELGLEQEVAFLGLRSDIANVLHSLDVYVLSSSTEGFSIACVEAMAAGTPVVATRSGGPEEIIEHERSGLLVPTQDPPALAAAVTRLVDNPRLADDFADNARERVQKRYELGIMLQCYENLFSELTLGRSRSNRLQGHQAKETH